MSTGVRLVHAGEGKTFQVLGGDIVTCKVTGEETGNAFALFETIVPPGGGPPPHVHHREDETFYVIDGTFEFRTPEGTIPSGPGGVVHAPRDIPHYFRNVGKGPGRLLIAVHPSGFETFIEEFAELPLDQPPDPNRLAQLSAKYGIDFLPEF